MDNPLSYKELIEQIKRESNVAKKLDSLATMVFTMATNDNMENSEEHKRMSRDIKKIKTWVLRLAFIVACLIIFLVALNPKLAHIFTFWRLF